MRRENRILDVVSVFEDRDTKKRRSFSNQEVTVPKPCFVTLICVCILVTNFKGFSLQSLDPLMGF